MRRNLATIDRNTWSPLGRPIQEAMAHGIENDMIYGGLLAGQTALQALNVAQVIQNCLVPTRRVTWEGRVFKYGRATAAVGQTSFGLKFWYTLADGMIWNGTVQAEDAGKSIIRVLTTGAEEKFAADELKGGYVIVHVLDVKHNMIRRIVGNSKALAGSEAMTITVDVPWPIDIAETMAIEVLRNPYMGLRQRAAGGDAGAAGCTFSSVAGMPQVKSVALNSFHWIQTWGPCWVNPLTPLGEDALANRREVFFDYEGAICDDHGTAGTANRQTAGFVINADHTGYGPPLIMLQISP